MTDINTFKRKIVLLGDGAVGKTSLIRRFVINRFDDKYLSTVGSKVTEKNLLVTNKLGTRTDLKLLIWDFMGQKGFRNIERSGLTGTAGALLVYDISRAETLTSLEDYWIPLLKVAAPDVPIIFLANKIDLSSRIEKYTPEATALDDFQNMVFRYNAKGYFTSALDGTNVENAFISMGKFLMKDMHQQTKLKLPEKINEYLNKRYCSKIIRATDEIIMDFYENFGSTFEETMPIIRKQFEKAGVDINNPTIDGLRNAIMNLKVVESNFWSNEEVSSRMKKRLAILNQIDEVNRARNIF